MTSRLTERRNAVVYHVELEFNGTIKTKSLWGKWKYRRWEIFSDGFAKIWANGDNLKRIIDLQNAKIIDTRLIDKTMKIELKNPLIMKIAKGSNNWCEVMLKYSKSVNNSLKLGGFTSPAVVSNSSGAILAVNKLFEDLFEYKAEEIIGKNVKILMPPSVAVHHDDYLARFAKTQKRNLIGKPRLLEGVKSNGTRFSVMINLGVYLENEEVNYLATFLPTVFENASPKVKKYYDQILTAKVKKSSDASSSGEDETEEWTDNDQSSEYTRTIDEKNPLLYSQMLNSSINEDDIQGFSLRDINATATRKLSSSAKITEDTALILACEQGKWSLVKKLVESGASVNATRIIKQSKKINQTQTAIDVLLSHPVQNSIIDEMIKLLIDNGADIRKTQFKSKLQLIDLISKPFFSFDYFTNVTLELAASKNLNSLDLSRCELRNLQSFSLSKIISLSNQLTTLDLSNNKLEELPTAFGLFQQLRILNMCNNNIKSLPNSLGYLKLLKELIVKNNPLEYPPRNIIKQGCKSIIQFLSDQTDKMSDSLNLKMMIFSDKKSSNTSLIHSLSFSDYQRLVARKKRSIKSLTVSLSTSNRDLKQDVKKSFKVQGKMKSEIFRLQKSEKDLNITMFRNSSKNSTKAQPSDSSVPLGFLSFMDDKHVNILQEKKSSGEIENVKIKLASKDCVLLKTTTGEARANFLGVDLLAWIETEFGATNKLELAQELLSLDIIQRVGGGGIGDQFVERNLYRLTYETDVTVEINCKSFVLDEQNLNRFHYLFTENTIYVILFDLTKSIVDAKLEFWLQYIYCRSQLNSSILIVGINSEALPPAEVEAKLVEINKIFTGSFNTVKCITAIDLNSKFGIPELRQIIRTEALQILENSPPISNSYTIVYDIIKEVRNPPVVEYSEIQSIATSLKFRQDDLDNFLRYFNQSGLIISFPQSNCIQNLNDYVIIDPNWVSNSPLLNHSLVAFNKGIIKKDDLKVIWNSKEFNEKFQLFLMSAFEEFEIFLRIYEEFYIIPFSISSSNFINFTSYIDNQTIVVQRDVLFTYKETTFQIHRIFQLNYIPPAAIMRLTVRLLEVYSPRELTVYVSRNSVVFEKGKTLLILEQDESQRLFSISLLCYEKKKKFLSFALELFRLTIDSWYSIIRYFYHIESTQWIPCNKCLIKTKQVSIIGYNPQSPQSEVHFFNISSVYKEFTQNSSVVKCNFCGVLPLCDIDYDITYLADIPKLQLGIEPAKESNSIGRGAFGSVNKVAIDDTNYAVKFFGSLTADQYFEIRREIWVMNKLRHENIVNMVGISITPFAIVMDLAPLGDLYSYLHNQNIPDLSWKLRIKIALNIARAMMFMHTLTPPVIHRDLKSPNILLYSDDPEKPVSAKVIDFGLSLFLYNDGVREKKNERDVQTPTWLAPEVIFGDVYTEKSDVYAFGIILYELLTRKHPFRDMLQRELNYLVEDLILSGMRPNIPPNFDSEFAPPFSQHYCTLMQEAWSHNPHERPTFQGIVTTLESIANDLDRNFSLLK